MGETKVNAGVRVAPALKARLELAAREEDRTLSQLCELLLGWACEQLEAAGGWAALKGRSVAGRAGAKGVADRQAEIAAKVAREREARRRRRRSHM
jgi:hypothetical protein